MNVAIDTNVLIWGLKAENQIKPRKTANQDVKEMQKRCGWLLDRLADEAHKVFISSIALGEILTGIRRENHGSFVAELQRRFHIAEFDIPASSLAARLWQDIPQNIAKEDRPERRCLHSDVMIVAAAKVATCRQLYTHEPSVRKIAELAGMEAPDLPKGPHRLFPDPATQS